MEKGRERERGGEGGFDRAARERVNSVTVCLFHSRSMLCSLLYSVRNMLATFTSLLNRAMAVLSVSRYADRRTQTCTLDECYTD